MAFTCRRTGRGTSASRDVDGLLADAQLLGDLADAGRVDITQGSDNLLVGKLALPHL